jgi:hypothetical protein
MPSGLYSALLCNVTYATVPFSATWPLYTYTSGALAPRQHYRGGYGPVVPEDPEVAAVRVRAERERTRRREEEYARVRAERDAAQARAEQLLLRWLSPGQEYDYRNNGRFDVAGSDGRRWRILCCGQTGNVQLLDQDGGWTHAYCAHPRGLPDPDAWLAQAMAIAHDAPGFLAIANLHDERTPEPAAA